MESSGRGQKRKREELERERERSDSEDEERKGDQGPQEQLERSDSEDEGRKVDQEPPIPIKNRFCVNQLPEGEGVMFKGYSSLKPMAAYIIVTLSIKLQRAYIYLKNVRNQCDVTLSLNTQEKI
ncbi:hypothetical protein TNCV_3118421 [Trichonephila clavipes]|uniref:Uncharacterized protein n=1 Tax=Trichonephila clavipes TaxID=2585209 RepID=A0A8X6W961_TRICX|nr:hypothetical protein TNCV_3118421 [Trichonephila clavipes]